MTRRTLPAAWIALALLGLLIAGGVSEAQDRDPRGSASTGRFRPQLDPPAPGSANEVPGSEAPGRAERAPSRASGDTGTFRPSPKPGSFRPSTLPRPALSPQRLKAAQKRLAGLPATLVVIDPANGRTIAYLGGAAARVPAAPCSTFKIPNTLISLEEGAVSLADNAIPRDPEVIPDDDWRARGNWAEDQDLRSALRHSTVWYFQELARRVGEEAMGRWLATFDYGNRDISGGLDRFWLSSSLRISAVEQAEFLAALVRGDLPVDEAHVALLEDGIRRDAGGTGGEAWTWYGKTGSCQNPPIEDVEPGMSYGDFPDDTPRVGWMVGWIDHATTGPKVYAYRVDAADYEELKARRDPVIRPLLADLGLLPAE